MKVLKQVNERVFLFIILILTFILFNIIALFSEGTFDAGDGIRHYLISRYSWNHPSLFLDSWGKPFYTLLSSPFSQFGFYGITLFNILCGSFSAYFVYKVVRKLNYKNSLLAIPFLLFAPIYFPTMNSGLTEPLFGLVLIASIYLVLEKKHYSASVLVSLLPFVRTEGFLFLPLFFIFFAYNRSFLSVFLLSFGTFIYSVIGFFYFGDFLWIKTQNPYNGINKEIYGHGRLLSFVLEYDFIWGGVLTVLLVVGILFIVFQIFFSRQKGSEKKLFSSIINVETLLILGIFVVFFAAHTFMWWKGLANSMGLVRVFAGVMPCTIIICLKGFNLLTSSFLFNNRIVKIIAVSVVLFFIVLKPFKSTYFPFVYTKEQVVVKEAADWIKDYGYHKKKIYYLYPYLPIVLDIDAFDNNKAADLWGLYPLIKKEGISAIPDGTIVFWDAHFGPNECVIPIDMLMNDPNFDLLKTFYPEERFTTLGGYPFSVSIFEKRNSPKTNSENQMKELAVMPFDLNNCSDFFSKEIEYGSPLNKKISDLPQQTSKINFSCVYVSEENRGKDALVVLTINNKDGKNLFWDGKPLFIKTDSLGVKQISADFTLSLEAFQASDNVIVFIWNKEKKDFSVKEKKISLWGKTTDNKK